MEDNKYIDEVGLSLLQYAKEAEYSVRGMVSELFPYIYVASFKMSARGISSFLLEHHQVKISAATVAKALREPNKHIDAFLESVEPSARIVAEAHDLSIEDVLCEDPDHFAAFTRDTPTINTFSDRPERLDEAFSEYQYAKRTVQRKWFGIDIRFRELALVRFLQNEKELEIEGAAGSESR